MILALPFIITSYKLEWFLLYNGRVKVFGFFVVKQ